MQVGTGRKCNFLYALTPLVGRYDKILITRKTSRLEEIITRETHKLKTDERGGGH